MPVWLELAIRVLAILVAFLTLPLIIGQTEHKVMAHMQGRLGPMYAGAYHGWAQLVADGVKFVQKEDVTPRAADRAVFRLAPVVSVLPYLVVLLVIPLGPRGLVAQPLDIGLFFLLAEYAGILVVAALTTVLFLGGWRGPFGLDAELGWLWTLIKVFAVAFVIIWLRVAYPRLREDQLQRFCWLGLVPLALLQLVLTAAVKVAT